MENGCAFWQNRKTALPQQHSVATCKSVLWGKAVFSFLPKLPIYTIWRGTWKFPKRQRCFPNFSRVGSLHSVPLAAHFLRFFSDYILKKWRRNDGVFWFEIDSGKKRGPGAERRGLILFCSTFCLFGGTVLPYVIVAYRGNIVKNMRETVTFISTLLFFGFYNFCPFAILTFFLLTTWRCAGVRFKGARVKIVTHRGLLIE